jgi:exosortase C (VPDSG-CTERM-specific)
MSEYPIASNRETYPEVTSVEGGERRISPKRIRAGVIAFVLLCAAFFPVLLDWFRVAMGSDLHSHVVIIPLVTIYLLYTGRDELAWHSKASPIAGGVLLLMAGAALGWVIFAAPAWSEVDLVALKIMAFVGAVWGISLIILGVDWVRSAMFSLGFLLFMIPLPDFAVIGVERFLMVLSAHLSETLFSIGGIPVFRSGQVLELPGMVLEVAQECSGIRSSWVLFITSVLAAYLFLPTTPRRLILVAAVLPLAVLRNSVRIFVIGWLCVNYGPHMIDSWIHHRGGPVFFAASLVPLFLIGWFLRKRKGRPDHGAETAT